MTPNAQGFFSGKRLVIFGAGYVGAEMARLAVARGMQVTALTRNAVKAADLRAQKIETVVADLAETTWHDRIEGGAEFVLNCVSSGGGGVAGYTQSYLGGMESILRWARQRGAAGTLIYTSSTSVYPQGDGAVVDETAAIDGGGERARVLVATEAMLRAAGQARNGGRVPSLGGGKSEVRAGVFVSEMTGEGTRPTMMNEAVLPACERWFILRLAGIYGPTRHHLLEQVRAGEIAGRGDHHLNLAHRDDICAAIWAVMGAPAEIRNEIFNVADDRAATKAAITAWLAGQLGLPEPKFSGAPAAGRREITPDRVMSNAKLKRVLGWQPRFGSYREGYGNLLSR